MRILRVAAVGFLAIFLPLCAFAQTTDSTSLSALLAQITSLEQQISSLSSSSSISSNATIQNQSASTAGVCPALGRTLSLGSSGQDVSSLQLYLEREGFLQASATGYFGVLTQGAVSQWQESKGIVSGGDAATTGLGVVGPKTRLAIASSCAGSSPQSTPAKAQCIPTSPPLTECPTTWQPVLDSAGCAMYYQCSIALPSAGSSSSAATTSSSTTNACPVVAKPSCNGAVAPFQINTNGCIVSYQCVI